VGAQKFKKMPILDSHLRCSALNPPHAVYEMALGGSLDRSRSQLYLVCRVCWHSSNNQCTMAGKRSKVRLALNFGARKTVENRQKSNLSPLVHWPLDEYCQTRYTRRSCDCDLPSDTHRATPYTIWGGRAAGSVLEKNSTLQFSPTVAPILHETSSPRYQMKGLVTSYRTVTGFGWVGAAAAEICGFSGLLSF